MAEAWAVYDFGEDQEIRVGMRVDWDTPDVLPQLRSEVAAMLADTMRASYEAMGIVPEVEGEQ